jgi:hypothetical protein
MPTKVSISYRKLLVTFTRSVLIEIIREDWKDSIQSIGISSQGHEGVIFIETASGSVVFKATNEVSIDVFLSELAQSLGLRMPQIRPVSYDCR